MSFLVLRSRSSRCQRLSVERPPVHAPTRRHPATTHRHSRTPQRHSRESGNPGWGPRLEGSGSPPPNLALHGELRKGLRRRESRVAARSGASLTPSRQRPPAHQTRKGGPHARRWTQTRPCWRSCSVPPPGATPLLAYLRKTPPGPTGPARDPDGSQSKENHPTASARAPPPGNNCCFTPRPASKDDKKHKAILQREINQTALLLTEAAKPSNEVPCRRTGRASVAPGPPVVDSAGRRVQTAPSGGGCRRGRCVGYRSS